MCLARRALAAAPLRAPTRALRSGLVRVEKCRLVERGATGARERQLQRREWRQPTHLDSHPQIAKREEIESRRGLALLEGGLRARELDAFAKRRRGGRSQDERRREGRRERHTQ